LGFAGNPSTPSGSSSERGDVYTIDTSNILFIFCGAFTGLERIVEKRLGKRVASSIVETLTSQQSIGFGTNMQSNSSFFMPSSYRFSDPAEENNILNHVISEDLQKYGFMYSSFLHI
jgi:ATP-dependent Clp protease ATP-binding subunit ClpX